MKYGVLADKHFSGYSRDKIDSETGLTLRLSNIVRSFKEVIEICRERKIKRIISAGDTLHNKSIIYSVAQSELLKIIRGNKDIEFYFLDGNHDIDSYRKDAISSLQFLDSENNVTRIDTNDVYRLDNILFVPYSLDIVNNIITNSSDILISHFGLNEAVLASGIHRVSDISIKDLVGKYKLVILGHYHNPQEIINDQISIYYTGSPCHLDWNDKNQEKRFLIFDSETLEVESVTLNNYTKYIELVIEKDNADEVMERAKAEMEQGNFVKLVKTSDFTIDTNELPEGIQYIDRSSKEYTDRGINRTMTDEEILSQFLKAKGIDDDVYKEKLLSRGKEFILLYKQKIKNQ